jgi:hypothetical protein
MNNSKFECGCNGAVQVISDNLVLHACNHKGSPLTSYYDGKQHFGTYERVQINPKLTNGEVKYNWFFKWDK